MKKNDIMKDTKIIVSYKIIITFIDYILNNYLKLIEKEIILKY